MSHDQLRRQIRAGRELLGINESDVADLMSVSLSKISRAENGDTKSIDTLLEMKSLLDRHGITLSEDGSVLRRKYEMKVLHGQQGFWSFYDDVYETIREQGGNILINGVVESDFSSWFGEKRQQHKERMEKLKNFSQKMIIPEKSSDIQPPTYATTVYRMLPADQFPGVPFYLYGTKLAIINFEPDDVQVFIINQPKVAAAYEKIFFSLWAICTEPQKK